MTIKLFGQLGTCTCVELSFYFDSLSDSYSLAVSAPATEGNYAATKLDCR